MPVLVLVCCPPPAAALKEGVEVVHCGLAERQVVVGVAVGHEAMIEEEMGRVLEVITEGGARKKER